MSLHASGTLSRIYHAGTSASPVAVLVAQSLRVAVRDGASSLGGSL